MMSAYAVSWRRKPYAGGFLIDCDSLEVAAEIAIRLNMQASVYDVQVTTLEYEEDPELKARIWARIEARLREMPRSIVGAMAL